MEAIVCNKAVLGISESGSIFASKWNKNWREEYPTLKGTYKW